MSVTVKRSNPDALKKLNVALKGIAGVEGKVGWFKGLLYPGRTTSKFGPVKPISVAKVAIIQEYGEPDSNIPARPFMRPTVAENKAKWMRIAAKFAKQILENKITPAHAMELLGQKARGDIQKTIKSIWTPALAQPTAMARYYKYAHGADLKESTKEKRQIDFKNNKVNVSLFKPLIDTGYMISTISNSVEIKP